MLYGISIEILSEMAQIKIWNCTSLFIYFEKIINVNLYIQMLFVLNYITHKNICVISLSCDIW